MNSTYPDGSMIIEKSLPKHSGEGLFYLQIR